MDKIKSYFSREPAKVLFFIRSIILLAIGFGVFELSDANLDTILSLIGVILGVDAATTSVTRRNVYSPNTAFNLVDTAVKTSSNSSNAVWDFIKDIVARLTQRIDIPQALALVAPLAADYAGSQLTPELKREIASQIHTVLRNAGLVKKTSFPARTASMVFIFGILLTGCADVATQGVNFAVCDPGMSVTIEKTGYLIDAGDEPAYNVALDLQGVSIEVYDIPCSATENGVECLLGQDIDGKPPNSVFTEPQLVELTGIDVSAQVYYERSPGGLPLLCLAE